MIFVSKIRYANLRAAFARRVYRAITFENSTGRACESSRGDATVRIMSVITVSITLQSSTIYNPFENITVYPYILDKIWIKRYRFILAYLYGK